MSEPLDEFWGQYPDRCYTGEPCVFCGRNRVVAATGVCEKCSYDQKGSFLDEAQHEPGCSCVTCHFGRRQIEYHHTPGPLVEAIPPLPAGLYMERDRILRDFERISRMEQVDQGGKKP